MTERDRLERQQVLLDEVIGVMHARHRPDLAARLADTKRLLSDPAVRILIAGEFKMGKSALVNAVLGFDVCPVDDDLATAVPTLVRWADREEATITSPGDAVGSEPVVTSFAYGDRAQMCSEAGNPGNHLGLQLVELGVPSPLLAGGIQLVDTPGVGGLASVHNAATVAALPAADAVLFVSDAAQELSMPELEFLKAACSACPVVVEVVTKIDFQPAWRRIVSLDRAHLARAGLPVEVLPVSVVLPPERSGLDAVRDALDRVWAGAVARRGDLAMVESAIALRQVEQVVRAEREGADPARAAIVLAELADARAKADQLNDPAAGWLVALDDGMGDLRTEIDYDLAGRLRGATRQAEERIASSDPADAWDDFAAWLEQQVMSDVAATYLALSTGAETLAATVAERFEAAEADIGAALQADASRAIESVHVGEGGGSSRIGARQRGVLLLEGSWTGIEAFSMVGGLIGLSIINPLSLVLGIFMGRRVLREEKQRQLASRREQARQSVTRYLEEVTFRVNKDVQDALRRIHRGLRASFATSAAEISRSIADAVRAAEQARAAQGTGTTDVGSLDAELAALDSLAARVAAARG